VGTVAEISHIAADGAGPYRIRFADGLEADVAANAFDLLVRVKAPTPSRTAEASIEQQLGDRVIYRCVIGSRAYGLDTPDSDTDRRGVYQAPTDLVVSLDPPPERLEDDANQEVLWELRKFLVLALKANPIAIEVLFSPLVDVVMPAGQALLDIRAAFLSRLVSRPSAAMRCRSRARCDAR
jgi:hypothetical protein